MNAPRILELAKFSQGCKLEGPVSAVGMKTGNGYGEQFSISEVPQASLVVMPGAKLREYHDDLGVATEQHLRVVHLVLVQDAVHHLFPVVAELRELDRRVQLQAAALLFLERNVRRHLVQPHVAQAQLALEAEKLGEVPAADKARYAAAAASRAEKAARAPLTFFYSLIAFRL